MTIHTICRVPTILTACTTVALLLTSPRLAPAFTSCPTFLAPTTAGLIPILKACASAGHYQFTEAALLQFVPDPLSNYLPAQIISSAALERLASGVIGVDSDETSWTLLPEYASTNPSTLGLIVDLRPKPGIYQSCHHFDHRTGHPTLNQSGSPGCPLVAADLVNDAQAFSEGLAYLYQQQQAAISLLQSGKCANVGPAIDLLAHAIHALQDAYSHSNYADVGAVGIGSAGQNDFNWLLLNPPSRPTPLPATLNNLRMTLYDLNPIAPNDLLVGNPEDPLGNCSPTNPLTFCHLFWSKDYVNKPCDNAILSSLTACGQESTNYFAAASNAAIAATTRFVQGVISSVGPTTWNSLVGTYGSSGSCPVP